MPSSSLFLGSSTTLFSVLSLLTASTHATASSVYTLTKEYAGSSFFDGFDFYAQADPNHGFVTYEPRDVATTNGLIKTLPNGDVYMGVDSNNTYATNTPWYSEYGYGRPSVRITTQDSFEHGLFIADVKHMPGGVCGVWPAFWTVGADGNWPTSGEIDIVEGVNNRAFSLAALHTGAQCSITGDSQTMTGSLQSTDCQYDVATGAGSVGCAILDTDTSAYGSGLNNNNGAYFAMEWTSDAIKIWAFERGSAPPDIAAPNPDPSSWVPPDQIFNGPGCDIDEAILAQKVIFNTNFCGDFGQAVWASEGCAAQTGYNTCADYVANNPSAFADQYWQFGSLNVYTMQAPSSATSTTTTTTTTTSTTTTTTTSMTTTTTTAMTTTTTTAMTTPTTTAMTTSTTTAMTTSTTTSTTTSQSMTPSTSASASTTSMTTASVLTTGQPQSSYFIPPMGSNVPIPSGGYPIVTPNAQWGTWANPTTTTTSASTAAPWSEWAATSEVVTATITTTWVEPCPTGWTTQTTVLTTTHCGCTETPAPTIPMTVITTTCPEAWGFTTPVVITVPVTPVAAAASSWTAWQSNVNPTAASTWATWAATSSASPVAAVSTFSTATWSAWSSGSANSPVSPAATSVPATQAWTTWNATGSNPHISTYTGAAAGKVAAHTGAALAIVALAAVMML